MFTPEETLQVTKVLGTSRADLPVSTTKYPMPSYIRLSTMSDGDLLCQC